MQNICAQKNNEYLLEDWVLPPKPKYISFKLQQEQNGMFTFHKVEKNYNNNKKKELIYS